MNQSANIIQSFLFVTVTYIDEQKQLICQLSKQEMIVENWPIFISSSVFSYFRK